MKKQNKSNTPDSQFARIFHMETQFIHAQYALTMLKNALDLYEARSAMFDELEAYLKSPEWQADYAADEAGQFVDAFPRGVLSQDGLYNLLEERDDVLRRLALIFAAPKPSDDLLAD